MVSFLDPSQLRAKIAKGFKGKLLDGVLTRTVSAGTNEYGDPIPGVVQSFKVHGCVDSYSVFYRATAGIAEGDFKIILIAGLCETAPRKEDNIEFPNYPKFQVRVVDTDAALAHYECQSFEVK